MSVYLGRDGKGATAATNAVYAAVVSGLNIMNGNLRHLIYANSFPSPDVFNDLHMKAINCCGTIRPDRNVMPRDFGRKLRLKRGDIKTRVKVDLTAVASRDKRNINILTNKHRPSAECNVCG
jgi:hypothetical protein